MTKRKAATAPANRLLSLLPSKDYERLRRHLHRVPLNYRQSLYRANKAIEWVYFIEAGVGSLVNTMANGEAAEVGTVGNEGVVGLPLLLGDNKAPTSLYVQVPGEGVRIRAAIFNREMARSASMARAGAARDVQSLVDELCATSPEFAAMWRDNDVQGHGDGVKVLHHPTAGPLSIEFSAFAVDGDLIST
jgi:CRP-like cAMP-binding protein